VRGGARSVEQTARGRVERVTATQAFTEGNMFGREQSRDTTLRASMTGKLQGTAGRVQSEGGGTAQETVTLPEG
jgi:hypothetical protein